MAEESEKKESKESSPAKKTSAAKKTASKKTSTMKKTASKKTSENKADDSAKDSALASGKKSSAPKKASAKKTGSKKAAANNTGSDVQPAMESVDTPIAKAKTEKTKAKSPRKTTKKKTSSTKKKSIAPQSSELADESADLYPEEFNSSESIPATSQDTGHDASENDADLTEEVVVADKPVATHTPQENLDFALEWLRGLYEKMQLQLDVKGTIGEDGYSIDIDGQDSDVLLGLSKLSPKSIDATQTVLTQVMGDRLDDKVLVLDVDNFQQKRQSYLAEIADKLSASVKTVGQPITIAGFNAFERRVIHQHLSNDNDLNTESTGQGIFRRLKIQPK